MDISYFRFILSLFLINLTAVSASDFETDITFQVQAGKIDCFYQKAVPNQVIDLEYQVIDSSHGDLDISFQMADPTGLIIAGDYKKRENTHRHTTTLNGDYRFCFDNTFSTFSSKTVFFDLLIDDGDRSASDKDYVDEDKEMDFGNSGETYTMKVRDIVESVNKVRDHVSTARRLQELLSAHEARDRNLAEEMCAKVLVWSALQIALVAVVGVFQVIFVKSLFEQKQMFDWRQFFSRSMY